MNIKLDEAEFNKGFNELLKQANTAPGAPMQLPNAPQGLAPGSTQNVQTPQSGGLVQKGLDMVMGDGTYQGMQTMRDMSKQFQPYMKPGANGQNEFDAFGYVKDQAGAKLKEFGGQAKQQANDFMADPGKAIQPTVNTLKEGWGNLSTGNWDGLKNWAGENPWTAGGAALAGGFSIYKLLQMFMGGNKEEERRPQQQGMYYSGPQAFEKGATDNSNDLRAALQNPQTRAYIYSIITK